MPAKAGFYALTRAKLRGVATIGDVDLKFDHPEVDFGGIGNQYSYNDGVQSDASISMGRIDFVINGGIGAALQTSVAVPMTGTDANITVVSSYPSGNSSDSASWYGLLAGSTVNSGDRDPKLNHIYSTLTLDNVKLDQTVSGGVLYPALNSGLRAIQGASGNSGHGSPGKIVVNNLLDMKLTGRRIEGVYVSGAPDLGGVEGQHASVPLVVLKDTQIVMDTLGADKFSSAIKIGKARLTGQGRGVVESHGKLFIDGAKGIGSSVLMMYSDSALKANFAGSSADVTSSQSVLVVGGSDWGTHIASKNIVAEWGGAKLRTVSTTSPLVLVDGGQTNVQLTFDRGSDLGAATNGLLMAVTNANNLGASSVTVTLDHGSQANGLTNVVPSSRLQVQLDHASSWSLAEKSNGDKTSTFTQFDMSAGSTLHAFKDAAAAAFVMKGAMTSTDSLINMVDGAPDDVLTVDGSYAASGAAAVAVDTCLGDSASPTDVLVLKGGAQGVTQLQVSSVAGSPCGGALTTGAGIKVIEVEGDSPANAFELAAPVQVGQFAYKLVQADGQNWYLQSEENVAPSISGSVPAGEAGVAYGGFTPVLGQGVTQPVTWSLKAGALPPGMQMDSATGAITGTPTESGRFPLTIVATNAAGSAELDVTLVVAAQGGALPPLPGTPGAEATAVPTLGQGAAMSLSGILAALTMVRMGRRRRK